MNAPNSTPGERDLDALRRAQRAHEPSMEEILASIRSIIADDREPVAARPAPKPDAGPSGPQIVYSKGDSPPARAVEPPPVAAADAGRTANAKGGVEPAATAGDRACKRAEARAGACGRGGGAEARAGAAEAGPKPESAPAAAEAGPLLSDQADQAVSAAFDALSTTLALQSSELAENVAREILRPLLKTWLDENLPSMVERLVRAEIQRVARGGR
jgi:cell pole-organizing protein PopZ